MINRIPPVAVFIGIVVCFVPKSVGQVTPTNVVQVPLGGEVRPVTILLNHSIAAWRRVYGDYQTDEDNELRKNWQLRRFLLTVMFSGRPALSTRIELKSKYGEPPMTLAEQANIMNRLGLRDPEFNSAEFTVSWGKEGDLIFGLFYANLCMLEIRTRQDPPED
jgi:hypothetical protein